MIAKLPRIAQHRAAAIPVNSAMQQKGLAACGNDPWCRLGTFVV
jgi:hypothetical protein